ncbi:MAG: hypothetical protein KGI50_03210 [Patescibacteria group bacterium]|nr:hypothetical protein [Patescibacteria group bacterium]MDE2438300.1 hypothetical protein [Patescibacteria group bacterium]
MSFEGPKEKGRKTRKELDAEADAAFLHEVVEQHREKLAYDIEEILKSTARGQDVEEFLKSRVHEGGHAYSAPQEESKDPPAILGEAPHESRGKQSSTADARAEKKALAEARARITGNPSLRAEARKEGEREATEAAAVFEALEPEEQNALLKQARKEGFSLFLQTYLTRQEFDAYTRGDLNEQDAENKALQRKERKPRPSFFELYLSSEEKRELRSNKTDEDRKDELRSTVMIRRAAALAYEARRARNKEDVFRKETLLAQVLHERVLQAEDIDGDKEREQTWREVMETIGTLSPEDAASLLHTLSQKPKFRMLLVSDKNVFFNVASTLERIPAEQSAALLSILSSPEGLADRALIDALADIPGRFKEHLREKSAGELRHVQGAIEKGMLDERVIAEIERTAVKRASLIEEFAGIEKNREDEVKFRDFTDHVKRGLGATGRGALSVGKGVGFGALITAGGALTLALLPTLGIMGLAFWVVKMITQAGLKQGKK